MVTGGPGKCACLLEGPSAVSRGSLRLPWTALWYVSMRAFEDCLRFILLLRKVAGAGMCASAARRLAEDRHRMAGRTVACLRWACICYRGSKARFSISASLRRVVTRSPISQIVNSSSMRGEAHLRCISSHGEHGLHRCPISCRRAQQLQSQDGRRRAVR